MNRLMSLGGRCIPNLNEKLSPFEIQVCKDINVTLCKDVKTQDCGPAAKNRCEIVPVRTTHYEK